MKPPTINLGIYLNIVLIGEVSRARYIDNRLHLGKSVTKALTLDHLKSHQMNETKNQIARPHDPFSTIFPKS